MTARRPAAAGVVVLVLVGSLLLAPPVPAFAATPSPSPLPCLKTLKFGGALYLDADVVVAATEVGPKVGETDPNPTHCGLPDRLSVYRHNGHLSTDELVYIDSGRPQLFRSAGVTGFPAQDLLKWLVLVLVVGIVLFAAIPAVYAHVRQPPITVGGSDDWRDDVERKSEPKISGDGD